MLPSLTTSWCQLVEALLAIGDRGPELALQAARALADETARADAHVAKLADRFQLSIEEQLVAWTLACAQLDPKLGNRLESLSGSADITVSAISALAYSQAPARGIRELSPGGTLFRYGLLEFADARPAWARRTVRASERMLTLALLDNSDIGDARCWSRPKRMTPKLDELVASQKNIEDVERGLRSNAAVVMTGLPSAGKRTILTTLVRNAKTEPLEVDLARMPEELEAFAAELRVVAREVKLLNRIVLLGNLQALDGKPKHLAMLVNDLAPTIDGPILITSTSRTSTTWGRSTICIDVAKTTSAQRESLWLATLGDGTPEDGVILADQYPLATGLIVRAASAARDLSVDGKITPAGIANAVRSTIDDKLSQYANRVEVTQTWADLVLQDYQVNVLAELVSRIRERRRVYEQWGFAKKVGKGLGISALFSGPPGTGKSMVASLIAKELGLELYQVDLPNIVSKWIGETEKQLANLFDAAEAGHAILLFDEADSLFGKRTDVKSSNDRYANLETNYLLQRLESFNGICLLTSNHESAIDSAFMRRLSLHLRFEVPDVQERVALWKAMVPEATPIEDGVDFSQLAMRFEMTGGYIRNAALRAAFFAAHANEELGMHHFEHAAQLEYESMGKLSPNLS